jgi:hypothetical protein
MSINRSVSNATFNMDLHLKAMAFSHSSDRSIGINYLHLGRELQVGSSYGGRPVDDQTTNLYFAAATIDRNRLAIKQNVKNVLPNPRNSSVLVVHTSNTNCGDRTAFKATNQDAPK